MHLVYLFDHRYQYLSIHQAACLPTSIYRILSSIYRILPSIYRIIGFYHLYIGELLTQESSKFRIRSVSDSNSIGFFIRQLLRDRPIAPHLPSCLTASTICLCVVPLGTDLLQNKIKQCISFFRIIDSVQEPRAFYRN